MKGRRDDALQVSDLLRAAARLEGLLSAGYGPFARSWVSESAAIRELELIGEAAGQVSASVRRQHPEVAWAKMRGLSSFAKHEYWRVRPEPVGSALA